MKQYIVDTFTSKVFSGNPAAVCVMHRWLPEETMLKIAMENNLSETAFVVQEASCYKLRWFTPVAEIDLCGHATLATAYVVMTFLAPHTSTVSFSTVSGVLTVEKKENLFEMDLPAYGLTPMEVTPSIVAAVGATPVAAYMGRDLLCVFDDEAVVRSLKPHREQLQALDGLLFHATARGTETDCVSRSFAPKLNVWEDPVCGSGHCHIVPYWAKRLNKPEIVAYQASARGGTLFCCAKGDRVRLAGGAVLYAVADIHIGASL